MTVYPHPPFFSYWGYPTRWVYPGRFLLKVWYFFFFFYFIDIRLYLSVGILPDNIHETLSQSIQFIGACPNTVSFLTRTFTEYLSTCPVMSFALTVAQGV